VHRNLDHIYLGINIVWVTNIYEKFKNNISEILKLQNFEFEVIWQTIIRTKRYQLQLPRLFLVEIMAINDFFLEFLRITIQENSEIQNLELSGLNGVVVSVANCYPKGAGFDSRVMLGIFPLRKRGLRTLVWKTNLGKDANLSKNPEREGPNSTGLLRQYLLFAHHLLVPSYF
jgi:hypothetical protein